MSNKNANTNRGDKQKEGKNASRKRVLVLEPKASNPKLLTRKWKWADQL